jgi:hypothetical protein
MQLPSNATVTVMELETPPLTEADELAIQALLDWLYQRGLAILGDQADAPCTEPPCTEQ